MDIHRTVVYQVAAVKLGHAWAMPTALKCQGYYAVPADPLGGQNVIELMPDIMCCEGEDFVGDTVRRSIAVLDYLVAQRYTDPARVAAFGTSRGAFMAFHFAAVDRRVRSI